MIKKHSLRLHLTNVAGVGAIQLILSLLPAFDRSKSVHVSNIYLPDRGDLANYISSIENTAVESYKRKLPNALSRLLECLVFSRRFDGNVPLLVLGDIPLRCLAPQTVFVQMSLLAKPIKFRLSFESFKFLIARRVFHYNSRFASAFIVQTDVMRALLSTSYPSIANRIHVIAQPVPEWLLEVKHRRRAVRAKTLSNLRLIYPAASYPHKNHILLSNINRELSMCWPVESLKLTLPVADHPAPSVTWISCVGFLTSQQMIQAYSEVDGVLFLSTEESYGFPLLEAMFMGLPIVCPDLPYAHALCSDGAIYFDPLSITSLHNAIETLNARLSSGWWPDWTLQLSKIPKNWDSVAEAMISIACK
jgi:glycosyltransferase involved in cell wall biosynthesis